jgi:hypothetical protein
MYFDVVNIYCDAFRMAQWLGERKKIRLEYIAYY